MEDEDESPRTLIRGFLRESKVSKSAVSSKKEHQTATRQSPRKVVQRKSLTSINASSSRSSSSKKTPSGAPSAQDVANRLMSRTRSNTKRKRAIISTPTDETTPKTLLAGLMKYLPVSTAVKPKRQKTDTRPSAKKTSPVVTRRLSTNKRRVSSTPGDNATPRTLLTNFLKHAPVSTPVVGREEEFEQATEDEQDESAETSQDSIAEDEQSNAQVDDASAQPDQAEGDHVEQLDDSEEMPENPSLEEPGGSDNVFNQSADTELDENLPEIPDKENEEAPVSTPVVGREEEFEQATEDSLAEDEQNNAQAKEGLEEIPPSPVDSRMMKDTTSKEEIVSRNSNSKTRQRDVITPVIRPGRGPGISPALTTPAFLQQSVLKTQSQKPLNLKPPAAPRAKRQSKPTLNQSVVRRVYQHFSTAKTSKEALTVVQKGCDMFFKQMSNDLAVYAQHARRKTIEQDDVELLMRRQHFITDKQPLFSLVEKYLGTDDRSLIIPVAKPNFENER